jgi:hypothetical protein
MIWKSKIYGDLKLYFCEEKGLRTQPVFTFEPWNGLKKWRVLNINIKWRLLFCYGLWLFA